jgi:hypothetical protein
MKTLANYPIAAPALALATHATGRQHGWMPAPMVVARSLDLSHWQSRAARGFTWNSDGAMRRRRPH